MKWIRFWSCWSLLSLLEPIFFRSNVGLTFSFLLVLRLSFYMRFTALRTRPVNFHCTCTCSSMPDLLAHYWLSSCRRPTRIEKGPTLQCVCRRVYIFKGKAENESFVTLKKAWWPWSNRRVVRVVYGFRTRLRFLILYRWLWTYPGRVALDDWVPYGQIS